MGGHALRKKTSSKRDIQSDRISHGTKRFLERFSLQNRLFLLFIMLLTLSIVAVGVSSYLKARDMTKDTIEDRLVRETELIGHIASNLKFLYVSDEDYFKQQLEINIREQRETLLKEGIESSYFYITNEEAVPFTIEDNDIPSISGRVIDSISEEKNGLLNSTIDGERYTLAYQNMQEIEGVYVLAVPTRSYMGAVNQMATYTVVIMVISIAVSVLIILFFVRSLTKPLSILRDTMRKVRNGTLEEPPPIQTTIPELISLHKSYHSMIDSIKSMLTELKQTTVHLDERGKELQDSSKETLLSSQQLIDVIEIVKRGAEQTASSSENSAEYYKDMKLRMEAVISNMDVVFGSSDQLNQSSKRGNESISELINTTLSFEKEFEQLTTTMKAVQDYSSAITNLVGIIQGMAEQTKLLALNATIEAARAGESGRGFSVVANEIGKLAEQSSSAAKQITESISNMEGITHNATHEFEQMLVKTKGNLQTAHEANTSIDELMEGILTVSQHLHGIQSELKELEGVLPDLELVAVNFSSISQETLASTEEMFAGSQNQIEQMERTHEIGLRLTDLSTKLNKETERCKVSE